MISDNRQLNIRHLPFNDKLRQAATFWHLYIKYLVAFRLFFTVKYLKNWYGRLYGVLLGGFYYSSDYENPEVFNGIAGIGIGYESIFREHFSFPLHFGYYAEFPNEFKMDFVFGGGFRFRF